MRRTGPAERRRASQRRGCWGEVDLPQQTSRGSFAGMDVPSPRNRRAGELRRQLRGESSTEPIQMALNATRLAQQRPGLFGGVRRVHSLVERGHQTNLTPLIVLAVHDVVVATQTLSKGYATSARPSAPGSETAARVVADEPLRLDPRSGDPADRRSRRSRWPSVCDDSRSAGGSSSGKPRVTPGAPRRCAHSTTIRAAHLRARRRCCATPATFPV